MALLIDQEVPGIHIPETIHARMRAAAKDGAREGICIAVEMINEVK